MSYADTLPLLAEQERQELQAFDHARRTMRSQYKMCKATRKAMLNEFYARVRLGHIGKVLPCK